MLCYAFLCYAMLCCANLFFNLLEHMWQTLTELPTVQIWDAVCSWDNEVNHAAGDRQIQAVAHPTCLCYPLNICSSLC